MPLGMYAASVPIFIKQLGKLAEILDKGAAFAESRKLDPAVVLNTRLYPNMYPLVRQAQEVMKHARWASELLRGQERSDIPTPETTFAELKDSIAKTVADLKAVKPEQIDGSEELPAALIFPGGRLDFTGETYLQGFAIPNLYFHLTVAYNILRHLGVDLGKRDFIAF